jgi:hypothetical protein
VTASILPFPAFERLQAAVGLRVLGVVRV